MGTEAMSLNKKLVAVCLCIMVHFSIFTCKTTLGNIAWLCERDVESSILPIEHKRCLHIGLFSLETGLRH